MCADALIHKQGAGVQETSVVAWQWRTRLASGMVGKLGKGASVLKPDGSVNYLEFHKWNIPAPQRWSQQDLSTTDPDKGR